MNAFRKEENMKMTNSVFKYFNREYKWRVTKADSVRCVCMCVCMCVCVCAGREEDGDRLRDRNREGKTDCKWKANEKR